MQAEKERLQEDVSKLTREKDLAEVRLRSYETESTQLAPTLEETQWEVSHDSSLCDSVGFEIFLIIYITALWKTTFCCKGRHIYNSI